MNILTIDVGTTCVKAQVFNELGEIIFYQSKDCLLKTIDKHSYIDINQLVINVKAIVKEACFKRHIDSIAFSSLGESFVCLDKDDNILFLPMLYTDTRGEKEIKGLYNLIDEEKYFNKVGVLAHPMYSIAKILYLKNNFTETFKKTKKILLICDYLNYIFTNKRIIDYSLASRTGLFNVKEKEFDEELLNLLNIDKHLFSKPLVTGSLIGNVSESIVKELNLNPTCKVILGSHDQIMATIGSGIYLDGQFADGMGTVECITAIFNNQVTDLNFAKAGYPIVPFLDNLYCTYMLNYTNSSLINWFRKDILHNYKGSEEDQFKYLESFEEITDILLLPYFAGNSTPYQDINAKGAFINITSSTKDVDLYRAILEGTSYEMKLNIETISKYKIILKEGVATGGGSNSSIWLQIKSDIFNLPIKSLRSSEGGLCGLAMISAITLNVCKDLKEARDIFVKYKNTFTPSNTYQDTYNKKYNKYKKLYHILKEVN